MTSTNSASCRPTTSRSRACEYFDTYDWEFTLSTKEKIRERMGELLRK